MLRVDRLRALCAVAEHGSIGAAARALHVTPSGVSQQLGKFEREVGVELLVPAGRGVQLTDAGRLLARRGQEVISLLAQAESEVVSLDRDVVGDLRIGSFSSAGRVVVPTAVATLRRRHPQLRVSFFAGETEDLIPAIVRRELDLAVVDSWVTMPLHLPEDAVHTLVHRDSADVALSRDHPLASRDHVDLDEIADMPWTTWKKGAVYHTWLVQTLRNRGVEPDIRYEVPEFAAQLEFVAHGLAAALVPRLARVWVPDNVAIVPVRPTLEREIYALRRADNDRPTVRAGIEALTEAFAGIDA
ncbi:LysR family transcriptional regulator [Rhodococcus opacus]|uniref:LysR family transcriptional regulator n=1 Tax=Rhodococcus opacus TaxID=37919 RepID=UPI0007CD4520|nr:LysR family transcriptional regulator [Rhodococcus opacus]MDX5968425.1 LysR family transcriptional regulator [Rhodococcus opacus]NKY75466.1 LysR family transcriptional regulator [Rhodococcus opacus]CAG7589083.1 HTH-type transcriptional regulator CysL [Rhodococcus opacus]